VKTVESPRDLILSRSITQLSKNYATSEEIHDLLLLSRPDYTIFDEMRDTADFQLYVDLRLAGVGMVGVVHATSPIDAVQRFVRRVELGMIPSIIDTVIYMKDGEVKKVYSLSMTVKVPAGMGEEDLSRPVVVVKDFLTGEPEYEIYVFGEETFVVPLRRGEGEGSQQEVAVGGCVGAQALRAAAGDKG
jgi:ATPase